MDNQEVDRLAYLAYKADMKATGDPIVYTWERLGEEYKSRYRAIVQAIAPQREKRPLIFDRLPSGFKQDLDREYTSYGDYMPTIGIRCWLEIPDKEGVSQWSADGYATSRQYGGIIAENLFKSDGLIREVWNIRDGLHHPRPQILDFAHGDYGFQFPKSLPTPMTTLDLAGLVDFSRTWAIAYYHIHESNEQYVKVEDCHVEELQPHLAWCKLTFSRRGEQVKLLWRLGRAPHIYGLCYPGQVEF